MGADWSTWALLFFSNPDLVMPPKPNEKRRAMAFYNIDFSLQNQMAMAGQSPSSSVSSVPSAGTPAQRDPVARKIQFLKRRKHHADADDSANKVIEVGSLSSLNAFFRFPSIRHWTWFKRALESVDGPFENRKSCIRHVSMRETWSFNNPYDILISWFYRTIVGTCGNWLDIDRF